MAEVAYEELSIEAAGQAAKSVTAPTGKVITSVGFRFRDPSGERVAVELIEIVPFGTDGTRWTVMVNSPAAGTLRVYATCVDA